MDLSNIRIRTVNFAILYLFIFFCIKTLACCTMIESEFVVRFVFRISILDEYQLDATNDEYMMGRMLKCRYVDRAG